jgi:HAD superfamily hydrolase (TIGR01509 family)
MKEIYEAVIFDLDGTLIDSEKNYALSDGKLFSDYGLVFSDEIRREFIGKGVEEFLRLLREEYGIDEDPQVLLEKKNRYYLDIARSNTHVFPEMERLLKALHTLRIPMAVASGSPLEIIKEMLSICNIEQYFRVVVSSQETARGKPHPDVFLEAARRLGIDPGRCLVLEDSPRAASKTQAKNLTIDDGWGKVMVGASTGGQQSWESDQLRQSIFTYYFVDGLRKNNGSVRNAFYYAQPRVSDRVRSEKGAEQNPQIMATTNNWDMKLAKPR